MSVENGPNPPAIGYAEINQRTMDYLVKAGPGRAEFVRFWRLMAEAVVDHPSAFAFELMNEPVTIRRKELFETWRDIAEAVNNVIPDLSVSITDTGEVISRLLTPFWFKLHLEVSLEFWKINNTLLVLFFLLRK